MARLVYLLQIIRFAEVTAPDLQKHRLAKIKELILLKILAQVRFFRVKVVFGDPI